MNPVLSEQELISAIASRNPVGAAALYDQYAARLFKVICCSARDKETAEAILEKTLTTVWHNFNDYQLQDKHLMLWMVGIARNHARQS
jgi:DNA-directed RNA polymerase specialized sigma24 family protein